MRPLSLTMILRLLYLLLPLTSLLPSVVGLNNMNYMFECSYVKILSPFSVPLFFPVWPAFGAAGRSWQRGERFVSSASCLTSWVGVLFLDAHQTPCPLSHTLWDIIYDGSVPYRLFITQWQQTLSSQCYSRCLFSLICSLPHFNFSFFSFFVVFFISFVLKFFSFYFTAEVKTKAPS